MAKVCLDPHRLTAHWNLLQPSRPALVSTLNPDGTVNVAPFGWNMPISVDPPWVAVACVARPSKNHTLQNVEREGEFVLNVPTMDMLEPLVSSSYHHPEGRGKLVEVGLTPLPSQRIRTPGVAECRAHLECRLVHRLEGGDHTLAVGEVVWARYEQSDFSDTLWLKSETAWPVIHMGDFHRPGGQTHAFVIPAGTRLVDVSYPPRPQSDGSGGA